MVGDGKVLVGFWCGEGWKKVGRRLEEKISII
jgi:hypothetical protein